MSRRRRERASLLEGDGEMSVMHIPGHEHQGPQEVTLEEIRAVMGNCQLCPLGQTRTNLVFGVGNPNARVMFVGEGPGRNEDLQGEPFVGAAGHKLDSLLSVAGLTRDQIYIANVVKCRPPGNRNPKPEEIAACSPFLREQIRSVWPDVLVCLGNFASQFVLRTEAGVTSLRGKLYQTGHFVVCPTFHPAACIYHSDWQPLLGGDLCNGWPVAAGQPAWSGEGVAVAREASFRTTSQEETIALGRVLGGLLHEGDVLVLTGDLGAGKTQLTKGIAAGMGVTADVTSPTFTIEMVYHGHEMDLDHFDLYRLDRPEQLEDTGLFDVLGVDGVCVIEWGEQFANEIGDARVDVFVTRLDAEAALGEEPPREVRFVAHDARGEELVDALVAATA